MEHCRHPLDNIYPDNSLVLLESMIPYVEPRLRLPLALLIKFQEIQYILTVFHNPHMMKSCGMDSSASSPEELLMTICKTMGIDLTEQLKTVQAMQNMQTMANMTNTQTMQNMTNMTNMQNQSNMPNMEDSQNMSKDNTSDDDFSYSRDEMIDAIRDILSEKQ